MRRRDRRVLEAALEDRLQERTDRLEDAEVEIDRLQHELGEERCLRATEAHLFPEQMPYPYHEGDTIVLGPEIFAALDGSVISWKGRNYVPGGPVAESTDWRDAITLAYNAAVHNGRSPYLSLDVREAELRRAKRLYKLLDPPPDEP